MACAHDISLHFSSLHSVDAHRERALRPIRSTSELVGPLGERRFVTAADQARTASRLSARPIERDNVRVESLGRDVIAGGSSPRALCARELCTPFVSVKLYRMAGGRRPRQTTRLIAQLPAHGVAAVLLIIYKKLPICQGPLLSRVFRALLPRE